MASFMRSPPPVLSTAADSNSTFWAPHNSPSQTLLSSSSPRRSASTRPRTPRSGAISSRKKRLKLYGDVDSVLGASSSSGRPKPATPSTPTTPSRRPTFSLSSPVNSPHRKKASTPSKDGGFLSPRSLSYDLDRQTGCRFIPKRDAVSMDVVRHVITAASGGAGMREGKENPKDKVGVGGENGTNDC